MSYTYAENINTGSAQTCWTQCREPQTNALLKNEVEKFADRADALAMQVLNEKGISIDGGEPNPPVIIRNYHYYPWFWEPQPTVIINNNSCSSSCGPRASRSGGSSKSDGGAALAVVLVLAAVVSGITVHYLGAANARLEDAKQEIADTEAFEKKMKNYTPLNSENERLVVSRALDLSELKMKICTRAKESTEADKQYRASLLGSTLFAALGATAGYLGYLRYPAESATAVFAGAAPGAFLAAVSAGYMLYKSGIDNYETLSRRDALAIRNSVWEIKNLTRK